MRPSCRRPTAASPFSSRTFSATCRKMAGRGGSICRTTSWPALASRRSIGWERWARPISAELLEFQCQRAAGLFDAGLRTERYLDPGPQASVSLDVDYVSRDSGAHRARSARCAAAACAAAPAAKVVAGQPGAVRCVVSDAWPHSDLDRSPRVAIVGGGLAGLGRRRGACHSAAAMWSYLKRGASWAVGPARTSIARPARSIDHCQHVAMGCCTNFLDFCQRTGIGELFMRYRDAAFLWPGWPAVRFFALALAAGAAASGWAAVVAELSVAGAISWRSRGRMLRLVRDAGTNVADDDQSTVLTGCTSSGKAPAAIERFWKVVLVSAAGRIARPRFARCGSQSFRRWIPGPSTTPRDVLVPRVSLERAL